MFLAPKSIFSSVSASVAENWQWILEILDEAHLPKLGLPVRLSVTATRHTKQAFNPVNNETIDIETGKIKRHQRSPVGFFTATKWTTTLPGSDTPAAVRVQRFEELNDKVVKHAEDYQLAPCIAHGDYVRDGIIRSGSSSSKKRDITKTMRIDRKIKSRA